MLRIIIAARISTKVKPFFFIFPPCVSGINAAVTVIIADKEGIVKKILVISL